MAAVSFLVPGRLETRTGGYEYDRQVVAALGAGGWTIALGRLDDSFPRPTWEARAEADRVLAALPDGTTVVIDGLAFGAIPEAAAREHRRLRLVALVHHPLADETGLDEATAAALLESERRALAFAQAVVVTSARTATRLQAHYRVSPERITVVEPGTPRAPVARGSGTATPRLLCVASYSPRKGHEVLLRALAPLADRPWTLACVGGVDRGMETIARVQTLVDELRLESIPAGSPQSNDSPSASRVELHGEADVTQVAAHYDRADVFVLPTLYEGYGMVVAEALARGLPIISTPTGAIADLVGRDAGLLVEAGDVGGWTAALARMLDPRERRRFADGARRRRDTLPTWDDAATRWSDLLTRVGSAGPARTGGGDAPRG